MSERTAHRYSRDSLPESDAAWSGVIAHAGRINDWRTNRYDPFQHLAGAKHFFGIRLQMGSSLEPGRKGETRWNRERGSRMSRILIFLAAGLGFGEMRSTLAHELVHAERGPAHPQHEELEEAIVSLVAASRLVETKDLAGIRLRIERDGREQAAADLEIDEDCLGDCLALLDAAEALVERDEQLFSDGSEVCMCHPVAVPARRNTVLLHSLFAPLIAIALSAIAILCIGLSCLLEPANTRAVLAAGGPVLLAIGAGCQTYVAATSARGKREAVKKSDLWAAAGWGLVLCGAVMSAVEPSIEFLG